MKTRNIWVILVVLLTVTPFVVTGCFGETCDSDMGSYIVTASNSVVKEGESIAATATFDLDGDVDNYDSICFEGFTWEYTSIDGGDASFSSSSLTWQRIPGEQDLLESTVLITGVHTGSVRISIHTEKFSVIAGGALPIIEVIESGGSGGVTTGEDENQYNCSLTFLDDTFNNDDWTAEHGGLEDDVPDTYSQESEDGNNYRKMVSTFSAPFNPTGPNVGYLNLFRYTANEYDPAECGAIEYLDFSANIRWMIGGRGLAAGYKFIVFQDNQWYCGGYKQESDDHAWTPWEVQLTASDFYLINLRADDPWDPLIDQHPDFSASGSPIMFGYCYGSRSRGADHTESFHSIDNWEVVVTPVPD
jgi:hypothetical protein